MNYTKLAKVCLCQNENVWDTVSYDKEVQYMQKRDVEGLMVGIMYRTIGCLCSRGVR